MSLHILLPMPCGCDARRAAVPPVPPTRRASVIWRCGNEYTNTISAKEAQKRGCKLRRRHVTMVQSTRPRRAAGSTAAPVAGASGARVDRSRQRARTATRGASWRPSCAGRGGKLARWKGVQQRRAREAGRREELPEVPRPGGRDEGGDRPQRRRHRRHPARARSCRPGHALMHRPSPRPGAVAHRQRRQAARSAGHPDRGGPDRRRGAVRQRRVRRRAGHLAPHAAAASQFGACFDEPQVLRTAVDGASSNDFATRATRPCCAASNHELMPVQVTLAQGDRAAS